MRDKIYAYLKSQKTGATSSELVEHVLKIKGASPHISETLIRTAIAGDHRFAVDEQRCWKIIEKAGTPLAEVEFILLSFLTLDTAGRTKILVEVSAQKLKNDKVIDHLHLLMHPGSWAQSTLCLPADLAREIKEGIPAEKATRALMDFCGEGILVGYDIQSSIHRLNKILYPLNKSIENSPVCLTSLTKKLIPNLPVKSLNAVASFFKLPVTDIQRTEKEIGIIADVFARYLDLLKKEEFSTLEEVMEFQYSNIEYVDFSKYTFDKGFLCAIPQKPGVYKMKDKNGAVIYVGKSKNLRARVSSYFWNTADRLQKTTDIVDNVYSIEYEIAGSELSAMLMEYRLIKQHRPRLNQQYEIHERAARYGNLKNFILILPSLSAESVELFFVKEGLPLARYEILKDAVNFSEVERILDKMYYEIAGINSHIPVNAKRNSEVPCPVLNKERLRVNKVLSIEAVQDKNMLADIEAGETDILLSWLEINKDRVNYINMDTVCIKETCLKLIKDYIRDEETLQKKHFRLL